MPGLKIIVRAHLSKPRFSSQDGLRAPNRGESTHFSHLQGGLALQGPDAVEESGHGGFDGRKGVVETGVGTEVGVRYA